MRQSSHLFLSVTDEKTKTIPYYSQELDIQ